MSGLGDWGRELDEEKLEDGSQLDSTEGAEGAEEEVPPPLVYPNLDAFVRGYIVPIFRRQVGDSRAAQHWAGDWWHYPEAVIRLEALWRSWEALRHDPGTGLSVWLRDHLDHHLPVLLSDYGPFGKSAETTKHGDPLPYVAPPDGLFPDVTAHDPADSID